MNTEAIDEAMARNGSKMLALQSGSRLRRESFDYLVNATYSNNNLLATWFRFPVRPLRFDLCEMLVLEMELPRVLVTILD